MKSKLADICDFAKEKTDVSGLDENCYISTENMMPNKGGITRATNLPSTVQTQAFFAEDTLVSNIRPYFRKIWYAQSDGGCSNDVLVFRRKKNVHPRFLYYVLSDDTFFDYATSTSKGTKMPRGDKQAIMNYPVPNISWNEQCKIADILSNIDENIEINTAINKNLAAWISILDTSIWPDMRRGRRVSRIFDRRIFSCRLFRYSAISGRTSVFHLIWSE